MELVIILLFLGVISGIFAGLLGIGGGIITVPALYYLFLFQGLPQDHVMQMAIATSLAVIFATTTFSTWLHYRKRKGLNFPILKYLIPGLIVGCITGAVLAFLLTSDLLREIFGGIAFLIGIYFSTPKLKIPSLGTKPNALTSLFGLIIGHFSALLGIGGGIFTIPMLLAYKVSASNTIATSSAVTLTTSLIGTITYLIMAAETPNTNPPFGFIDLTTFIYLTIGSLCVTPLGVKLSHTLHTAEIKRIFGIVLVLMGIVMIVF